MFTLLQHGGWSPLVSTLLLWVRFPVALRWNNFKLIATALYRDPKPWLSGHQRAKGAICLFGSIFDFPSHECPLRANSGDQLRYCGRL